MIEAMGKWVLVLALAHQPEPVGGLAGVRNPGGTVLLTWTLPADPSVAGVTVLRQRLAGWDEDLFELGAVDSFLDETAREDRSYGYWVFTRDVTGDLSEGVYVEVWSETHHEDLDTWCYSSAGGTGLPVSAPTGLVLLGLAALGRGPGGSRGPRKSPRRTGSGS